MSIRIRAFFIIGILVTMAFAQSNLWPAFFGVPMQDIYAKDSIKARLSTDDQVFQNLQKTKNHLEWNPTVASWQLQQNFLVETSQDAPSAAMNQFYNFSGNVVRDSILPKNGQLGFEWSPVAYFNRGTFTAIGDLGPVLQWRPGDIPLRIRGGISGCGWYDSLPDRIVESKIDDAHGDVGYYGACSAGNSSVPFLGQPIYINGDVFFRSIRQAGIAVVTGSALWAYGIGSGDSLFAFYGDSLSNGKEVWGSTGGFEQRFSNTPWRIARSFQAATGLKSKERFGFQPEMVYSYGANSVMYPTLQTNISDVQVRTQTINLMMHSRSNLPVVYSGGIKIAWGAEEWLFGKNLSSTALTFNKDSLQLDSLNAKLEDHNNYIAVSDHVVGVTFSKRVSAQYKLSAFRDSKTYTFSYTDKGLEVKSDKDNDRITINHHLGIMLLQYHGLDAELYGEYSDYVSNYLRSTKSIANIRENGYRAGLNLSYMPSDRFLFDERIAADAEVSDYFYKKARQDPFSPPPYQRRISSFCTGVWKIGNGVELTGRWNESYYDNGEWYGKEYRKSGDTAGSDYYAIQGKKNDYSLDFGLAYARTAFRIESGCRLQDVFSLRFDGTQYVRVNDLFGIGNGIEPYVLFQQQYRRIALKGRIARFVNRQAWDKWVGKNWDVRIMGQAEW
jgi:hypothetical protein